jgi:hypothetical protein
MRVAAPLRAGLALLLAAGCARLPVVPAAPATGGRLETLQSAVTVSLSAESGTLGGNGILYFRRPDRFRLALLSPFGQVVLDMAVAGDQATCLIPERRQAWRGSLQELPGRLGGRVWPLMGWIVAETPPAGPAREREFPRPDGGYDRLFYDDAGRLTRKESPAGDEVTYRDYRTIAGLAVPGGIEVVTAAGSRLLLTMDEPEVNLPLADEQLTPTLEGVAVLPLAELPLL